MAAKQLRLPAAALKDSRDFAKRSSRFFIVSSKPNQLSRNRFATVVGVKVDRTAVGRHRLKRRVREHLRLRPGSRDIIVTVLPAAKELSRKDFLQELNLILF